MSPKLRILIVDDEPLAIERLQILLGRMEDVVVVGSALSGAEALALVEQHRPDLCLLDIAIPDMSGIDIARALARQGAAPKLVFVTAFDSFAVAAFEIEAVDYLVKPVDPARLAQAIARVRRHVPAAAAAADSRLTEFWVSQHHGLVRIAASDIDRITAERDYMRLHIGARSWLINDSLANLEQQLEPDTFLRLHRGAIVNRRFIRGLRRDESGWIALLGDGSEQKVGRSYADTVRLLRGRAG
ncbi:MAG: LytTR family DNA-binding domain-containing protein [Pseudomonadota bacterium]